MKTIIILYLLLSSVAATSASDTTQEYNDTSISAEASINDIGDVELEDPKTAELINKIKEAVADGSFGDEDIFENYAANNGFGEELKHYEVIKFTSKGAIDITKEPMPEGVPDGFAKTHRAYMALRYSKDEKKKEMRYKDLYDDLVANEDEWLEFLDHLQNSEFAYECLRISYDYALIQQKKLNGQNWDYPEYFFEIADMMKKLINIQEKYVGSMSEHGKELFEEIEFLATYFIWHNGLWRDPKNEYGQQFKELLAYEVKVGWRPLVMQEWQTTRKQLKARGIHAPSNIDEVDDKVLYDNLMFEVKKNEPYWKKEDYGKPELKKDLIKFFEMNDNIVSHQKQERINKFVDELGHPTSGGLRAKVVYELFGDAAEDELKLIRMKINTVDDLDKTIDWLIKRHHG